MRKTYIEISQKLICCNKVKVIIITSEDVCWNIRNVKLTLYFFPAMRSSNPLVHESRAFSVIAPILWNDLPIDIRSIDDVYKFKSKLKTFLLKRVYELS